MNSQANGTIRENAVTSQSLDVLRNDDPRLGYFYHPVALETEIADGWLKATLLGVDWLIVKTFDGSLVAYRDRCPHRSAPLSTGTVCDGIISCGYHGWRFDDSGRCIEIPAIQDQAHIPPTARLEVAYGVICRYGLIFLAPKEPNAPIIEISEATDSAFMAGYLVPKNARQHCGYLADNFLDMAHFPFVHTQTFGDEATRLVDNYEIISKLGGFTARYAHQFANREDPGVALGERELIQRRELIYTYVAPFSLSLRISFLEADGVNMIGFFISPVRDGVSRLFCILWRNDMNGSQAAMDEAVAFEERVLQEDLLLHEQYKTDGFPLDLRLEVHTKADRITVALRNELRRRLSEDAM